MDWQLEIAADEDDRKQQSWVDVHIDGTIVLHPGQDILPSSNTQQGHGHERLVDILIEAILQKEFTYLADPLSQASVGYAPTFSLALSILHTDNHTYNVPLPSKKSSVHQMIKSKCRKKIFFFFFWKLRHVIDERILYHRLSATLCDSHCRNTYP